MTPRGWYAIKQNSITHFNILLGVRYLATSDPSPHIGMGILNAN